MRSQELSFGDNLEMWLMLARHAASKHEGNAAVQSFHSSLVGAGHILERCKAGVRNGEIDVELFVDLIGWLLGPVANHLDHPPLRMRALHKGNIAEIIQRRCAPKKRYCREKKFPGIVADAAELGVTRQHLYEVLIGNRRSSLLLDKYRKLKKH